MADGSIRIEATVSDEQAKKQITQMQKDIEKQSAAVDKQAEKVNKLAEQWKKVAAGGAKGLKMADELKATEKEAARLAARLDEVNAEAYKAQAEYQTKLKQAATGEISQEEFSASAQKLNELTAESDKLAESLRQADEKAAQLKQQIAEIKEASVLSDAGRNVADSLSNEQAKLDNMSAGLSNAKAEFAQFSEDVNRRISKNNSVITKLKNSLSGAFGGLSKTMKSGLGAEIDRLKAKFSNFGKATQKSMKKATGGVQSFGVRLRSIVAGALFFNVISKALTAMADKLGKALLANKTFATSFGQVKSNLLTAFQPIYEKIIPWLNMLMQTLAQVTAQMAQFIATVFGTTAQQAQDNAKALEEQAGATDDTAKATKDAEKALASFDTVQKLNEKSSDTQTAGAPQFNTDFSAAENQIPQWLTDFWKVFQESWAQYGQSTVDAAKEALAAVKTATDAIGAAFMAIWTNGTGLEMLNNLQLLLQTILGIITAIATAFTAAWNTGNLGEQMLQAIMNLLNTVIQIITAIGQAFIAAWNNGNAGQAMLAALMTMVMQVANYVNAIGEAFLVAWTDAGLGESIFSHLISIITNVATAVGNIAQRSQEAWEANNNGVRIWTAILGIIDSILAGFDKMTQAAAEWTAGLNLEPITSAFSGLLEAIQPLVDVIMNGLAWAYENILLPLASWVIEDAAPAAVNVFTAAFGALGKILEAIGPYIKDFVTLVTPIVKLVGTLLVAALNAAAAAIQAVGDAISYVLNLLHDAGSGIGSAISSLMGLSGTSTFSLQAAPAIAAFEVPALASGAVISPNSEFLAMLGDQKNGVNIETPLSTMIDAFNQALDARGGTGGSNSPIDLYIDGTKFARIMNAYNSSESRRRGVNLVAGGAI